MTATDPSITAGRVAGKARSVEAAGPKRTGDADLLPDRWSSIQVRVVALCFLINMLDGMDVVILSYIAPTLTQSLDITADLMGMLFSAGLAGMAIGGLFLAPLCDRYGRRRMILCSLVAMTLSMIASGLAVAFWQLVALRLVVGIGIGTVLAAMAALTAEYAPAKGRNFAVTFLQGGYPIGATLTGFATVWLLPHLDWHGVLLAAGLLSAAAFPLIWLLLPESVSFLLRRRPKGALEKVNAILREAGVAPLPRLPETAADARAGSGVAALLSAGRRTATLLLWCAIVLSFMSLYFVISWIPRLAIEAGLDHSQGIYAGAVYNIGAFAGITSLGLFASRLSLRWLILVFLAAAAVLLTLFGSLAMPLAVLLLVVFVIGFTLQGGFNGLYPLAARLYPVEIRATGIGWAMGVGRAGAVIGPLLGGYLLAHEVPLPTIFLVFAAPLLVGGLCVLRIRPSP